MQGGPGGQQKGTGRREVEATLRDCVRTVNGKLSKKLLAAPARQPACLPACLMPIVSVCLRLYASLSLFIALFLSPSLARFDFLIVAKCGTGQHCSLSTALPASLSLCLIVDHFVFAMSFCGCTRTVNAFLGQSSMVVISPSPPSTTHNFPFSPSPLSLLLIFLARILIAAILTLMKQLSCLHKVTQAQRVPTRYPLLYSLPRPLQ